MTVDDLIAEYEIEASLHGDLFARGDIAASNRAATEVASIYRELRRRGGDSRMALLPLLEAAHPQVRGWAAAHALEFAPEAGEAVLEALSSERWPVGFSAEMTLKVWRRGELRFT
jgi:glycine/D-amino acid oxidase-like deaminating enzyme